MLTIIRLHFSEEKVKTTQAIVLWEICQSISVGSFMIVNGYLTNKCQIKYNRRVIKEFIF